jgi:hypothetical protein
MDVGSDISTIKLWVVGCDEKGTYCLGVKLGHPVLGVYKYEGDKPHMHNFFHFMVVGEMAASQSVWVDRTGDSLKKPHDDYVENVSRWSSAPVGLQQCADG